mmetsp:Transcript_20406/g.52695  ORF Transcript_20406/g.52695 Transcript_20406/m.52695 type:complete len:204 (-) Transcript_20406:174-785(-)
MKHTLSNRAQISDAGWWIVHTTVQPSSCESSHNSVTTASADAESRPDVGSSSSSSDGSVRSCSASESLRFCPPEIPFMKMLPTIVCSAERSPSRSIIGSTFVVGTPASRAPLKSTSRTVSTPTSASSCCTYTAILPKPPEVSFFSLRRTSPVTSRPRRSGSIRRATRSRRLVFPAPEGPMSATTSPGCAIPEQFLSTCLSRTL